MYAFHHGRGICHELETEKMRYRLTNFGGSGVFRRLDRRQYQTATRCLPSSLSIKKGQDFSLGRNVNYFDKLKPNEENILMFWASWCPHCESLIEDMQQLDNFAVIRKNLFTVSEDSTIEEASVHEGDFPIYIDQDKAVYDQYELEHIPSVFILDDQGNIIGSAEGEKESLALLKKYAEYNG